VCEAELELLRSDADVGKILWFYGEEKPYDFKIIYQGRTSVLVHNSGRKIVGAEHLSAAALAFPSCQFKLNAPQGELPLLDGSAKLWEMELERAGGIKQDVLRFYKPKREFEIKIDARSLKFKYTEDGNCLEIKYAIERFGQNFNANVRINSTKDLEKIFLARTYIFAEELPEAGLSENLRGCGIVLGMGESDSLLFENEPAFHKILDFLGDITLRTGALPCGQFDIFNGGHELHHKVLENFT